MLTYYRNNLIHNFINESIFACALLGLSNIHEISKGFRLSDLWTKVTYLRDLLDNDFLVRKTLKT